MARKMVAVSEATHRRLKELRPYESISFDEFVNDMADVYESVARPRGHRNG
jgi:hypothetical protein